MITVEEALRLVEQYATPLAPRLQDLAQAAGLVSAVNITSSTNSPPYDKAMMDGYAVASFDRQPLRRVIEDVPAGAVPRRAVTPGTAVRIMTGAPLPEGADAVIQHERCQQVDEQTVRMPLDAIEPRMNVLPLGSSVRAGQTVVQQGKLLRPLEIAILAEAGQGRVLVVPQPTVAVLPTGNELVPPGKTIRPGQIRNSNGPLLTAAVATAGGKPLDLGIGPDDPTKLRDLVSTGLRENILLVSGGVSAGDFDFVPQVLSDLSVMQVFHKVSLRPGKPLWFGVSQQQSQCAMVFGLPGNPVSSFVCFELFVRPSIAALAGRGFVGMTRQQIPLAQDYRPKGDRAAYLPAHVHEAGQSPSVELVSWLGSADLAALTHANALIAVPAHSPQLAAGTMVEVLRI